MTQQEVLGFLKDMEYCHERLRDRSTELFVDCNFDEDSSLVPQIQIERQGESIIALLAHRFTFPVTPDYAETNEVTLLASLVVSSECCDARVAIDAYLDEGVEGIPAGSSTVHEMQCEGVSLEVAVRFLREHVDDICRLDNPLRAFEQPRTD
ncbi:hypothetical protein [Streptomyces celluloflavus]|uniref:hypothetical protein n=1 Tax=Streptomyces celluloflavus TaxID=58344 RepID=UPI0036AF3F11